jgi:predicted metallopeptidase
MNIFKTKKSVKKPKAKRNVKLEWEEAFDVKQDITEIVETLSLDYIRLNRVFCYRTQGSKARAHARTWMMPKIFQHALSIEPAYVIEVISKYYDYQSEDFKKGVLIHELLHIPKNFSGVLAPHRRNGRTIHKESQKLLAEYLKLSKK